MVAVHGGAHDAAQQHGRGGQHADQHGALDAVRQAHRERQQQHSQLGAARAPQSFHRAQIDLEFHHLASHINEAADVDLYFNFNLTNLNSCV